MTGTRAQVGSMLADQRRNAAIAWVFLVFLAGVVTVNVVVGDVLWAGFVGFVAVLCALPPVAHRNPSVMLPWEVVALASLPVAGRALATVELTGDLAMYLSVAALALIVAVELEVFTEVRMTYGFAIGFVVIATMATAGVWAVVRWASDIWLGTSLLFEPGVPETVVEEAVMFEFVYSTAAGIVAGTVFELYFRRRADIDDRIPEEAAPTR